GCSRPATLTRQLSAVGKAIHPSRCARREGRDVQRSFPAIPSGSYARRMPQISRNWIDRRHALQTAAGTALAVPLPKPVEAQTGTKAMKTSDLTAEEITRLLNLEPNATCGFVRVTYIAKQEI